MLLASEPPGPLEKFPNRVLWLKSGVVRKGRLKLRDQTRPRGFSSRCKSSCQTRTGRSAIPSCCIPPYEPSENPGFHQRYPPSIYTVSRTTPTIHVSILTEFAGVSSRSGRPTARCLPGAHGCIRLARRPSTSLGATSLRTECDCE